jgi:hypothetical protein
LEGAKVISSSSDVVHVEVGAGPVALAPEELDPADLSAIREAVSLLRSS